MTSPVDTSVKFFDNTMSGAPVLSGTAGALIALLDACLKDGFDTKTLTSLVALGGVMTATFTGTHSSYLDTVVIVAGVTGGPTGFAGANGEQKVTGAPLSTTRTWSTALPDGTYTGTITIKMAPLGFTKPFAGTNLAAYRSGAVGASGMYLRVDDAGTTAARVVGYETMTDVNTGTGPFPTAGQISGGGFWPKSNASSAGAVAWTLIGDGRFFYFISSPGITGNAGWTQGDARCFGDAIALRPAGDPWGCVLSYASGANTAGPSIFNSPSTAPCVTPRDYPGVGSALSTGAWPYTSVSGVSISGVDSYLGTFPSPVDGSLKLSKLFMKAASLVPRLEFPGGYYVPQANTRPTFANGTIAPGTDELIGRNLRAQRTGPGYGGAGTDSTEGVYFIDQTGPWR